MNSLLMFYPLMVKPRLKGGALHPSFHDVKLHFHHTDEGHFVFYAADPQHTVSINTFTTIRMALCLAQPPAAGFVGVACSGSALAGRLRRTVWIYYPAQCHGCTSFEPFHQHFKCLDCHC